MASIKKIVLLVLSFLILEILLFVLVDLPLSGYMRELDSDHPSFINIFRSYTNYAKSIWYLIPLGIAALTCAVGTRLSNFQPELRNRLSTYGKNAVYCFSAIAAAGITTDIIKPILGRARPIALLREKAYGFHHFYVSPIWNSMPSGHATTAFAVATLLCVSFPRMRVVWIVWAVVMAASRIMVNAHYLSDVIAGATVGCLIPLMLKHVFENRRLQNILSGIFPLDRRTS
jgi:undecaprenyl-diphosphatase